MKGGSKTNVMKGGSKTNVMKGGSKTNVNDCCRYGKREAVAYAASRLPATYGTTLRVFSEVILRENP